MYTYIFDGNLIKRTNEFCSFNFLQKRPRGNGGGWNEKHETLSRNGAQPAWTNIVCMKSKRA